jgi:dipeptidyl aminopeptidase/acylaminoacyl peptidase
MPTLRTRFEDSLMKLHGRELLILGLLVLAVLGVYLILAMLVSRRIAPTAEPGRAEVVAPANGALAAVGATLTVRATVAGSDVNRLEFWADDAPLYVVSRSLPAGREPWMTSVVWTAGWPGLHRLYVRGFSAAGSAFVSQPITLSVVPDARVCFASNREGRYAIFWSQLDGAGIERLTRGEGDSREPAISATGALAFTQVLAGQGRSLWQLDLTARAPRILLSEDAANASQPAWSPDGRFIAFVSNRSGNEQVWVAGADGGQRRRVAEEPEWASQPAWSPDSARLAYTGKRGDNWDIYRVPAAGGAPTRLTRSPAVDWQPAWSPVADQIAFVSNRDGSFQIYVMDAEGGATRQLTDLAGGAEQPRWSPDGAWILFVGHTGSGEGANARELYLVRSDGRDLMRLTDNAFDDTEPIWVPPQPGQKAGAATPVEASAPAGFQAEYFANLTLSGRPVVSRVEPRLDFDWGLGSPAPGMPPDQFSARWTATLKIVAAGDYLFDLRCDDGGRVWLDGALLVDLWGQVGRGARAVPARLEAGEHTLRVEYYDVDGPAGITLSWKRAGP